MSDDLDPSLAYTALIDMYPGFAAMPVAQARPLITALCEAWQQDHPRDKWAHARVWIAERTA